MRKLWAGLLLPFIPLLLFSQSFPEKKTLSGVVVNSKTGVPIPGATVVLSVQTVEPEDASVDDDDDAPPVKAKPRSPAPRPSGPRRVSSDGAGRFSFSLDGPSAGQITASRQGYFSEEGYGKAQAQVLPNKTDDFTLKLTPLGVFEGRVANREGEPLPGVTVRLVKVKMQDGRRDVRDTARSTTDDRGQYRLWHVFPGSYYLELTGRSEAWWNVGSVPSLPGTEQTYGPLYYPAAETQEQAQLMVLDAGETVTANFTAASRPAYKISGEIRVPGNIATLRLLHGDDPVGQRTAINRANGAFQIFDVVPGAYTLQANAQLEGKTWFGEMPVQVNAADVAGVVLPLSLPLPVTGKIEFLGEIAAPNDPELERPNLKWASIRAVPRSSKLPPNVPMGMARVREDGQFTLDLLPGSYDLVVDSFAYYPVSIRWDNVDVFKDGLTFEAGTSPDLKVVMRAGGGQIEGTLEGIQESLNPSTLLVIRRNGSGGVSGNDLRVVPVYGGHFSLQAVEPGDYALIAFRTSREVEYRNPAVLLELATHAKAIHLIDGGKEEVTLNLALEDKP